jgi:hypothetical protein
MSMTYHTADALEEFMDSIGTRQVCFVAAENSFYSYTTFSKYMYMILTLSNPLMIPVGIADFCVPVRSIRAQFVMVDVLNGKTMLAKSLSENEASARVLLDNFVYTQLRSYIAR